MEMLRKIFETRGRQTLILLRKNWILVRRNVRATIIQLLVPFLFVAFLWILQKGLEANNRLGEKARNVPSSEYKDILPIPRCIKGSKKDYCLTLAYVINGDQDAQKAGDEIIEKVRLANEIPPPEVRKFASAFELDDFLDANANVTQAAYLLDIKYLPPNNLTAVGVHVFNYTIQFNNTEAYDEDLNAINAYYLYVVPMQLHIQREIARYTTKDPNLGYKVDLLPFPHAELETVDVVRDNGPAFFFGALMFNFVIQLGQIVTEKELKLRDYMQLMGLKSSVFWFTWWVTHTIMNVLSVFVLVISGYIFQFKFFLKNAFGSFFFVFLMFGISMVPLTFFLSTLVKSSRTATSLGFVIFLVGVILQGFAGLAFSESFYAFPRFIFSLLPFALLSKGISDISSKSDNESDPGFKWSERGTNEWWSLNDTFLWFFIDFCIYWVLTWYFDNVMPNSHGTRKQPWFFLTPSYWVGPRKSSVNKKRSATITVQPDEQLDEDVARERQNVLSGTLPESTAVTVTNLNKTYTSNILGCIPNKKKSYSAVKGICFNIDSGSLFCLLGHNGAGKTTTINMLTGMFAPTSGDATIFGHSIHDEMEEIRRLMGVCPQHDILWDQLTGREHLEMFAAFKGLPADKIKQEVDERLADVELTSAASLATAAYSGGMKRRLSTAIALTADPQIVFLDEPTTGMDPVSRRQVWNLIEKVKRGRVIVLTTHSMEEADIMADKIVIMKKGKIECVGSSIRLKNKFGAGYRVTILSKKESHAKAIDYFNSELGIDKPSSVADNFIEYNIPRELFPQLPQFFKKLERQQQALDIMDIQLSLTTLEEVFLKVAGLYEFDE